jgi:hypothetical protein
MRESNFFALNMMHSSIEQKNGGKSIVLPVQSGPNAKTAMKTAENLRELQAAMRARDLERRAEEAEELARHRRESKCRHERQRYRARQLELRQLKKAERQAARQLAARQRIERMRRAMAQAKQRRLRRRFLPL